MILIVIFAVVAIVFGSLTHVPVLGIVFGVIATGAYYVHDVKRHPRVACRVCHGSGDKVSRVGGGVTRRPRGACSHCGGKKGVPRPALRLIDNSERKKILAGIIQAKKLIRRW
jgi:hypothetical protein